MDGIFLLFLYMRQKNDQIMTVVAPSLPHSSPLTLARTVFPVPVLFRPWIQPAIYIPVVRPCPLQAYLPFASSRHDHVSERYKLASLVGLKDYTLCAAGRRVRLAA